MSEKPYSRHAPSRPSPAVQTPQLAAEQLQLAALPIRMRGLEPAVGDGDLPGECTNLRAGRRYCAESSEHRATRGVTTVSTAEHGPMNTCVPLLETETIGRSPSALRLLCSGVAMKPRKGERPPPPLLQAAKTRSNRRTSRLRLAPA